MGKWDSFPSSECVKQVFLSIQERIIKIDEIPDSEPVKIRVGIFFSVDYCISGKKC